VLATISGCGVAELVAPNGSVVAKSEKDLEFAQQATVRVPPNAQVDAS
jgi:hypothetical protein